MGLPLTDEDRQKGYVEVSGRKGLGIKADDLIDALVANPDLQPRSVAPRRILEREAPLGPLHVRAVEPDPGADLRRHRAPAEAVGEGRLG